MWYDSHTGNNGVYYLRGSLPVTSVDKAAGTVLTTVSAGQTVVTGDLPRPEIRADAVNGSHVMVLDAAGRIVAVQVAVRAEYGSASISLAVLGAGAIFAAPDRLRRAAVRFVLSR